MSSDVRADSTVAPRRSNTAQRGKRERNLIDGEFHPAAGERSSSLKRGAPMSRSDPAELFGGRQGAPHIPARDPDLDLSRQQLGARQAVRFLGQRAPDRRRGRGCLALRQPNERETGLRLAAKIARPSEL